LKAAAGIEPAPGGLARLDAAYVDLEGVESSGAE
jgi:hypothetical protein